MEDKVVAVLKELAGELGTTVEAMWGILVRQAEVTLFTAWLELGLLLVFTAIAGYISYRLYKHARDEDDDFYPPSIGVACADVVITLIVGHSIVASIITLTYNPEYWALQEILKKF